jgi:hypothetical protein
VVVVGVVGKFGVLLLLPFDEPRFVISHETKYMG